MNNKVDVTVTGEVSNRHFGNSVSTAGDVNGDGCDDIIIGAYGNNDAGSYAGKAYIYYSNGQAVKPNLFYAKDVPQDQGGKVLLKWSKSAYDTRAISTITEYVVQRSKKAAGIFAWENLCEIPATHQRYYGYSAATPYDSTSSTAAVFFYRVVAKTANLQEMWNSNILSAYSVDNLSPAGSQNLLAIVIAGSQVKLNWDKNTTDPDVRDFAVYRSTEDGFSPSEKSLLATTTDTTYTDENPEAGTMNYYLVVTYDVHDNASDPSPQEEADLIGSGVIDTKKLPKKYSLQQNYPNPFNQETAIKFALQKENPVDLIIYNILGQKIRNLSYQNYPAGEHSVVWDGRDGSGKIVNSGVYIIRINAGEFSDIRKMTLIK